MKECGIPSGVARKSIIDLRSKIKMKTHSQIYSSVKDAAILLNLSLMNIHQPCVEYTRKVVIAMINKIRPRTILVLVKVLEEIPEIKNAATRIDVRYGSLNNAICRIVVALADGTNGGYSIAKTYYDHGISTFIYMHIDYNHLLRLRKMRQKGNHVILGHLAGNSVGLNALADRLEEYGIEVIKKDPITTAKASKK